MRFSALPPASWKEDQQCAASQRRRRRRVVVGGVGDGVGVGVGVWSCVFLQPNLFVFVCVLLVYLHSVFAGPSTSTSAQRCFLHGEF